MIIEDHYKYIFIETNLYRSICIIDNQYRFHCQQSHPTEHPTKDKERFFKKLSIIDDNRILVIYLKNVDSAFIGH